MIYVRFYDNKGYKRSLVVQFVSAASAMRFVDKWQNFGGYRRFNYDMLGEECPIPVKTDVHAPFLGRKNSISTARIVNDWIL